MHLTIQFLAKYSTATSSERREGILIKKTFKRKEIAYVNNRRVKSKGLFTQSELVFI